MIDRLKPYFDHDLMLIKEIILRRKNQLVSRSSQNIFAFWDFDGTLFQGDLSEGLPPESDEQGYVGLMEKVMDLNFVTDRKLFWKEYERLLETRPDLAYSYMGKSLEALPPAQLRAISDFAKNYLEGSLSSFFYQGALEIWNFLRQEGVRNFIISASPALFVQAAAGILQIPREDVFGINTPPFTHYGEGKACRVRKLLDDHCALPLLAAGNSIISDGPMCREVIHRGGMSLFVNGPCPFDHDDFLEVRFIKRRY